MSNFFHQTATAVAHAAKATSDKLSDSLRGSSEGMEALGVLLGNSNDLSKEARNAAVAASGAAKNAATASHQAAIAAQHAVALLPKDPGERVSAAAIDASRAAAKAAADAAVQAHSALKDAQKMDAAVSKAAQSLSAEVSRKVNAASQTAMQAAKEAALAADRLAEAASQQAEILQKDLTAVPTVLTKEALEALRKSPLYGWLITNAAALFMDPPHIIKVGAGYTGSPVYYVNGMLTKKDVAMWEGTALADHLTRPVWIIHNPTILEGYTGTPNTADDFSEAVYDRTWPLSLGMGLNAEVNTLMTTLEPTLGSILSLTSRPGIPFTQLNSTTRQVTHLLYHAHDPISVVSHSQGCLQARNAFLVAGLFRGANWIHSSTAWVATGIPEANIEIWLRPNKFHSLVNSGDYVAQLVGLQGGPGTLESFLLKNPHHEPVQNYFPKVQSSWLLS